MCGITGFISPSYTEENLCAITRMLTHRGPDAEGFYFDSHTGIGLGHRRLSILDLSAAGNQPFYSRDGRYVMVYNGEVFNFRELAKKYGIEARTHSDTEIILEAFASHGIECARDLNGMFAIAIWDKKEEQLFLIRDRIGIKPLYFYHQENDFVFASELKAITKLPVNKEINKDSVNDFLYLGYIPGQNTIFLHINKIMPGHYAVVSKKKITIQPYWQPEEHITRAVMDDEQTAKKELKALLESSVKYCMISDVPVGVFLSGGVDSSLIAALAQSQSSMPVKTFSIGFKEGKYNESKFAAAVASHIGSDHHEFIVTEQDALSLVETITDVYDEPYADSSAIPTMIVSRMAAEHVKVSLSGDGGDELFMGYGFYYWARRLGHPLIKALRSPIGAMLNTFGNQRLQRGSKLFQYPSARRKSHIFSQEQYYFTESEINSLLINGGSITINECLKVSPRQLTLTEEQSFFDIKNYLPEELLVKTDRASMFHSLEVRVPLLDHRLVEFALNLSPHLKLKGNTGKYLLKQVLYDYIPASYFDRPKWGFAVPLSQWLNKELRYLIDKYLSKESVEECGLVYYEKVEALKKSFFAGKSYLYNRLWVLILLHKWYREKR